MKILVRVAEPRDAPGIAALLAVLGYPAEADVVGVRLGALLGRTDYRVLVADTEASVGGVGCVHLVPTLHTDGPSALITALVVSETMRGAGVGRALVEAMEAFAAENGCGRIMVTTANHRSGAHDFYARLGYEFTGRRYARMIDGKTDADAAAAL